MNTNYIGHGSGARQWAPKSINIQTGCEHNCLICYAKEMSIKYNISTKESWTTGVKRPKDVNRKRCKYSNTLIMFPSSHDITPNNLKESIIVIKQILDANNDILIVSKPHLECIKQICDRFTDYKDRILFRFTIGSADNEVLKFWEPGAPNFMERKKALEHAFKAGYDTSVSCEPMMDNNIDAVINAVRPFITETIWIGKVKQMWSRLRRNTDLNDEVVQRAEELGEWQSDDNIMELYNRYKDDPMIMWKDSIQTVVAKNIP